MQRILLALRQLRQSILVLGLMTLISLSLFMFSSAPASATTTEELKLIPASESLSSQDKIDRAYDMGEDLGLLEEAKQASKNRNQLTDPKQELNIKTVTGGSTSPGSGIVEKTRGLVDQVTGK